MENRFEYNFLGRSGIKVSNICLGTSTFGPQSLKHGAPRPASDDETAVKLLDRFTQMGGNFIDTADMYSNGESEKLIGRWLSGKDRHSLVLTTKVSSPRDKINPNNTGLNRKHITHSIEKSLRHLQTDFVDMYMIHYWDNATPLEETLRTFNDLVRSGKMCYLGVSNLMGHQLQKIVDYCKFMGLENAINIQAEYNLLVRSLEYEVFHVCKDEGLSVTPWGPLRGGWLTGKYKRTQAPPSGSRIAWSTKHNANTIVAPSWETYENDEQCWNILDTVDTIAKETGKTASQVSIRWCLQKDLIPSVVLGAKTVEQLEENVGAAKGWSLTDDQMKLLDETSEVKLPPTYYANHLFDRKRTFYK